MILALDLIYTAFLIPILVAFEVPDIGWTWGCIINLIAGDSLDSPDRCFAPALDVM